MHIVAFPFSASHNHLQSPLPNMAQIITDSNYPVRAVHPVRVRLRGELVAKHVGAAKKSDFVEKIEALLK